MNIPQFLSSVDSQALMSDGGQENLENEEQLHCLCIQGGTYNTSMGGTSSTRRARV